MSKVAISYSSLTDAKGEAKALSRKLDQYADHLDSQVYKKLTSYSGPVTSNVSNAKTKLNGKISNLRSASTKYSNYANDIQDLKDECKRVDKAVKTKVSRLTAAFKKSHGIRNSHIENGFYYLGASIGNSSAGSRWVTDKIDEGSTGIEYIKDSLKEWYNYEGGKELIKGVLVGALEVAIAALAVVGAILSGGALIAIIAGVVAGVIALANGVINIANEVKAYKTTQNDDPATARRYSREDTFQDTVRTEAEYNGSGWQVAAKVVDVVNTVCTVITVVNSLGKFAKNGYKWATGNRTELKDIKIKDIFTKDTFNAVKDKFGELGQAFKTGGWSTFKDYGKFMTSDFLYNLKENYLNFDSFKDGASSIKSIAGLAKDLITDGINIKVAFDNIIAPGLTIFETEGNGNIRVGEGGQLEFDFTDNVVLDDISGIIEKVVDGKLEIPEVNIQISSSVLEKLSASCNVKVNVPDIHIPEVSFAA